MARKKSTQSQHDTEVARIARRQANQGYDVKADISGFRKPDTISGYRPDVVALKPGERKIFEVETPDSVDGARAQGQRQAFEAAADRSKKTTFTRKVTGK